MECRGMIRVGKADFLKAENARIGSQGSCSRVIPYLRFQIDIFKQSLPAGRRSGNGVNHPSNLADRLLQNGHEGKKTGEHHRC